MTIKAKRHKRKDGKKIHMRVPATEEEMLQKIVWDLQDLKKLEGKEFKKKEEFIIKELKEELVRRKIIENERRANWAAVKITMELGRWRKNVTKLILDTQIREYKKSLGKPDYLTK